MYKLIFILGFFAQDSSNTVNLYPDSIPPKSIMFKKSQDAQLNAIRYQHQQGFFCDFEDRINQNRKLNINLGVGEQ